MNIGTSLNRKEKNKSDDKDDKKDDSNQKKKLKFYETWTFIIFVCLILPFSFRSLLYAPFHIPSGSMKSTLLIGDFLFVDKSAYGYSKYSFPFGIPFFEGRIAEKTPQRGDVIVFRPPPTPYIDFIKRLIGMPGDKIQMKNGKLYINGKKVKRKKIDDFIEDDNGSVKRITRYRETLPNGVSYDTLDDNKNGSLDNTDVFVVPEGHFFMMGDNRDNSSDSRTPVVGFVPAENLVGKAKIIIVSTSGSIWKFWTWSKSIRTDRYLQDIK